MRREGLREREGERSMGMRAEGEREREEIAAVLEAGASLSSSSSSSSFSPCQHFSRGSEPAHTHANMVSYTHTHTHTRKLKGLRDTMAIVMILPSSVQAGIILMVYSPSPFIHFADMPTNQAVHCGCTFSSVSSLSEN